MTVVANGVRAPERVILPVLPPRSEPAREATLSEQLLATHLLTAVCPESVVDREQHALGVARMLLNMGLYR